VCRNARHDFRIESGARAADDQAPGVVRRPAVAVRPLARDGVVDVGYRGDAGELVDVLAGAAVGVARAVPALVMRANHRAGERPHRRRRQQIEPGQRVAPNELPFRGVERAGLAEDLGRHDDLADVVQHQAEAELNEAALELVVALVAAKVDPAPVGRMTLRDQEAEGGHVDRVLKGVGVCDGQILEGEHRVATRGDRVGDHLHD
jgi:hypothetical protein